MPNEQRALQETLKRMGCQGLVGTESSERAPYELNDPVESKMIPFAVFDEKRCAQMKSILTDALEHTNNIEDVVFHYSEAPLKWLIADPHYAGLDEDDVEFKSSLIKVTEDTEFALIAFSEKLTFLTDNIFQARTEVSKKGILVVLDEPESESYEFSFFLPFKNN